VALARVIGHTRAALLAELDAPRSTTDVARLLDITPGGASQHLGALRDAGAGGEPPRRPDRALRPHSPRRLTGRRRRRTAMIPT
jgi:predicted ArsR family transcriptional regulator